MYMDAPWMPSMKLDRFLDQLYRVPVEWFLVSPGGMIRTADGHEDCPMTAVARYYLGESYRVTDSRVSDAIGLGSEGKAVVDAADNMQGHNRELRALLLAATVNRRPPRRVILTFEPLRLRPYAEAGCVLTA